MDDIARIRKSKDIIDKRVKAIEAERGVTLTQRDIADEAGLSQTVISLYMRGNILGAKYEVVMRFLRWLGVSPNDFAKELELFE